MPAAKKLSAYPQMFWIIAEQVATGQVVETIWEAKGQALVFRNKIYGFKQALERQKSLLEKSKDPVDELDLEKVRETLKFAETFAVVITDLPDGRFSAKVMHKDHTPYAKMLEDAMARAKISPQMDREIEESLERLKRMQK